MVGSWAYCWEDGPPPPSRVSWIPQQLGFLDSAAARMNRILKKIGFSRVVHELGFLQKCGLFHPNLKFLHRLRVSIRNSEFSGNNNSNNMHFQKSGFPDLNQNGSKLRVFFKLKCIGFRN